RRYQSQRRVVPELVEDLRQVAMERPRLGYRRLHAMLRRRGWRVNTKLVRENDWLVRRRQRKKLAAVPRIAAPRHLLNTIGWLPAPGEKQCRRGQPTRSCTRAAVSVFFSRYAMVIGPTPPGTGVIARARSAAAANSTSPFSLPAALRFIPTSITVAPGLIHSPRITSALPMAATTTSARATSPARSFVRECASVT